MLNRKYHKIVTVILMIGLLIIINLITNYNYSYRLFYNDSEVVYDEDDFNYDNNLYEIVGINKDVKLIEIEFSSVPGWVTVEFTGDNFSDYNRLNENYTLDKITSKIIYVNCSLKGKMKNLRLNTDADSIVKVTINPRVPYKLNLFETFLIFATIWCFIYVFKEKGIVNFNNGNQRLKCIIMILFLCVVAILFYYNNRDNGMYSFYNTDYTDALINRRLDLDVDIDDKLIEAINPYDSSNRDFNYILDASYYNNKYYCYFGIWPNLLLFVPYRLIFGEYMTNAVGCLIYTIGSIVATFLLFKEITKKYFKKITFRTFILSFLYILFGSKLFWCMHRPNFYELVTIAAYFHVIFGLYLVLFNDWENKMRDFIGYTFLASAVLCRPTALLASIFIIPKMIDKFKKYKFKINEWLSLLIPYFVIGIITMYLNYVRFGNILEFGISYQLAASNLSTGSFSILNILVGIFYYLFGTYNLRIIPLSMVGNTNNFPILTDYLSENIGGGVLTTSFLGFVIFFVPWIVKFIKGKKLKIYLIMATVLAIIMIFVSSSNGASVGRYMLDFNYLIYFVIITISFNFIQDDKSKILNKLYIVIIIISIVVNFLLCLSNSY